jgi:sugar phosphate isomerase/epimerase
MDLASQVGCRCVAAPPCGATDVTDMDPRVAGERYAELMRIGDDYGVVPVLEFWGMSQTLGSLSEAVSVAMASGRRDACILADVFHMYKGGSPFEGLALLGPTTMAILHMNDYPADPPLDTIRDSDRVFAGDGIAPLKQILSDICRSGFRGPLSLELFNATYWEMDARTVAETGLRKMQSLVSESVSGASA